MNKLKTYVTIEVIAGDPIKGCGFYTVPWRDFPSFMEDYFDGCDWAQLVFDVVELTDEEYAKICLDVT